MPIPWKMAPGAPPALEEAVLYAVKTWTAAAGSDLAFVQGDGGMVIEWDETGAFRQFLGYCSFTNRREEITSARVCVVADWWECRRPLYSLKAVVLHEIGHALGIAHSDSKLEALVGSISDDDLPTMWSFIRPSLQAETLHQDDIAAVSSLYPGSPGSPRMPWLCVSVSEKRATRAWIRRGWARRGRWLYFSQTGGDDSTSWDFGDGTFATGSGAEHRYVARGTYTVTAECNGAVVSLTVQVGRPRRSLNLLDGNLRRIDKF